MEFWHDHTDLDARKPDHTAFFLILAAGFSGGVMGLGLGLAFYPVLRGIFG